MLLNFTTVVLLLNIFIFQLLNITPQQTIFLAFVFLTLLILTFTISGAIAALFSLNNKNINLLKTKQQIQAKKIVYLLDNRNEVYTSLLMANIFITICLIVIADYLINIFIPFNHMSFYIEVIIKLFIIGFIIIFFGRIFPKVWATQNQFRFAFSSVNTISTVYSILKGISRRIVTVSNNWAITRYSKQNNSVNLMDLEEDIDSGNVQSNTNEEKKIMKGVAKFGNISVKQVMRSRLDIIGISNSTNFKQLLLQVKENNYSRLPVYEGNLDEIKGILNTKDIIPHLHEPNSFNWLTLLRKPYFVPETKPVADLMKEFQNLHIHFAVVVDEFGGTSGIVTMEDILEEVVGDIQDEFDVDETISSKLDDRTFIFEGKTLIYDVCRVMKLPLRTFDNYKGESETLAGLLMEISGHIPQENSTISLKHFDFLIQKTEGNRVRSVQITKK